MFEKMRVFIIALLVVFLVAVQVEAQVPSEVKKPFVGGMVSQAGDNLNIGWTGGLPINAINGHFAWFGQRDTSGDTVLSETLNLHITGGVPIRGWELNAYSDVLRDLDRELQQVQYGYFVQFPEYELMGWCGKGGVGNAAQTRDAIEAQTGLAGKELEAAIITGTSLNWFGFANLHHPLWDVDLALRVLPRLDFSDAEVTATVSSSFDLSDVLSFNVSYQAVFETERRKAFGTAIASFSYEIE